MINNQVKHISELLLVQTGVQQDSPSSQLSDADVAGIVHVHKCVHIDGPQAKMNIKGNSTGSCMEKFGGPYCTEKYLVQNSHHKS